jgi:hypothetical protein
MEDLEGYHLAASAAVDYYLKQHSSAVIAAMKVLQEVLSRQETGLRTDFSFGCDSAK